MMLGSESVLCGKCSMVMSPASPTASGNRYLHTRNYKSCENYDRIALTQINHARYRTFTPSSDPFRVPAHYSIDSKADSVREPNPGKTADEGRGDEPDACASYFFAPITRAARAMDACSGTDIKSNAPMTSYPSILRPG